MPVILTQVRFHAAFTGEELMLKLCKQAVKVLKAR